MAPRVSVIVPVYRVEEYLPRCLRSLEEQTIFEDLEIILIDDGSPDRSGEICDEFAGRHKNVQVLHRQNGGVSSARNTGLAAATGDYIGFLDADDFVRRDAYQVAHEAAVGSSADIVVFRFAFVCDDVEVRASSPPAQPLRIDGPEAILGSLIDHRNGVIEGACDKLFRREVLSGLSFPTDLSCGEDAVLLAEACVRAKRALAIDDALYFYRERPGSAMHTLGGTMPDERISAHERIARIAGAHFPGLAGAAEARAHHMRLFVLNGILDSPDFGNIPAWERQIRALRRSLPRVLRARSRRWLPLRRKAYAVLLAFFPGFAARLHKRRALRRKEAPRCPQPSA